MMDFNKIYKVSKRLAQHYFDALNSAGKEELDGWTKEETSNQELMNMVNDPQRLLNWKKEYDGKSTQKRWEEFEKATQKKSRVIQLNRFLKYASIIVLPFLLGILVMKMIDRKIDITEQAETKVTYSEPVLILDNGETVVLNDDTEKKIQETKTAKISKKKGTVEYEPKEVKRILPQKLRYNTVMVPMGEEVRLKLSDGTLVHLNSLSKLTYPVVFSHKSRDVTLEGEGYFEVAENKDKPFNVKTGKVDIKVLGTVFNIKAYKNDDNIKTTLVSGSVQVTTTEKERLILKPNQQAVVKWNQKGVKLKRVDAKQYIQWIDGVYMFRNERLENVMNAFMRWHDFNVTYENESLKDIAFGGSFDKNSDIELVLSMFRITNKIKIERNGNNLIIRAYEQ
ncbi:DUF4974 domain-containing protein [Puteibacter caeruleilacunae]|nr:DUF4974 domain-containing protein [Puteibacter caeruleilacunae]